jgi:integrase
MGRLYKRGRVWYFDVRAKGKRIRKRVGTSKRVAELALKDAEVKIAKDAYGFTTHDIGIVDLFGQFLDYSATNHRQSTTKRYRAVLDHFRTYLDANHKNLAYVSQLNPSVFEGYKSHRRSAWTNPNGYPVVSEEEVKEHTRKGARTRTVNLELEALRIVLNSAIKWGYLRENPTRHVKFLKEDDKRPLRFLTEDECRRLLESSPLDLYPAYFTFLHTGMRKGELENLRWEDVDFQRKRILIRRKPDWNPKTGEREIPIGTELLKVLKKLRTRAKPKDSKDYVFTAKNSGHSHNRLRRELIKIARKAGIPDLTKLHTLRHTFASHLVMKGVDLPTVKKLMGHSDIQTTMIYAHLAPDHLADAVNKIGFG